MKKLVLLAMTVLAVSALAENGVINASLLNARREPTLKSPVMWKLRNGTVVNVTRVCANNWLEIEVDQSAPVYVSEAYAVGGKAAAAVKMYTGKGSDFPVWGELKKGEKIELLDDRAYGWVRIVPPPRLRAYVYSMYVKKATVVFATATDGCERRIEVSDDPWVVTPEAKPAPAKPEEKPAPAKPEAKPAPTKPEVKPEAKPVPTKPEVKPEAKPVPAKPATKPAAKPAPAKPEAKPEVKPVPAKPEAKPATKPAPAKPEVKPATKPAPAKPEAKPAPAKIAAKPAPFKPDAELAALGIKETAKGRPVKLSGTVWGGQKNELKAAQFALVDDGNNNRTLGFLYYPNKAAELNKLDNVKVTVQGESFLPPGWKTPVVVVLKIEKAR